MWIKKQYNFSKKKLFIFKKYYLHNIFVFNDLYRSSRSQMFFEIGVLKNFAIFTTKHLCCILFLIKLQASWPATFVKSNSSTSVFLWILRIFKNTYFEKHCERLLLIHNIYSKDTTCYFYRNKGKRGVILILFKDFPRIFRKASDFIGDSRKYSMKTF